MLRVSIGPLAGEDLRPLSEAREWFPGNPPPAVITLRRYVTCGCRGVVLESVILSGRRHTSKEAVQRFLAAVSEADLFPNREVASDA